MHERADKKRQTKPNVSMLVHEVVEDVQRYLRLTSHGEAARRIVLAALDDIDVIHALSPYFWRSYARGDRMWMGHVDRWDIEELLPDSWTKSKRLPIRFHQQEWRRIDDLSFALGRDRAKTIAALLRLAIESDVVLKKAAPGFSYRSPYSLRNGVFGRVL